MASIDDFEGFLSADDFEKILRSDVALPRSTYGIDWVTYTSSTSNYVTSGSEVWVVDGKLYEVPVATTGWISTEKNKLKEKDNMDKIKPERIIFNDPHTICFFKDGTKIVSKCMDGEPFIKENGVAMCIMKYIFKTRSKFLRFVEQGYVQPKEKKIKKTKGE